MVTRILLAIPLLLLAIAAGLYGGAGLLLDRAVVGHFVEWRAHHPDVTTALIFLTYLGGAPVLMIAAVIAALTTAMRYKGAALALLATTLGGRALVELVKWLVGRPRPALDAHPVSVFSQSFPSAHAGNTMITYGAIALFALPDRWRGPGLAAAVALSLAIGSTRPILGVHWPTDVVGGWSLGALWLLLCWTLWERVRPSRT